MNTFKRLFWPWLVLALISVQAIVFGYLLLQSSSPFQVRNIGFETAAGVKRAGFAPGEMVGVRREVCADRDIAVEFFPGLRTPLGALVPLENGASFMRKECRETVSMFSIPFNLPPGRYQYVNIVKYQSNLIGRDEQTVYPPLVLEVVSAP